jgi:RHS repeat-associated protein
MNKKTYRKSLICMLVAALVVTSFPSYVFGYANTDTTQPVVATEETKVDSIEAESGIKYDPDYKGDIQIVDELTSKRGEFEKHFVKSDGTAVAVSYAQKVHYQVDGVWTDIDSRIVLKDKEKGLYGPKSSDLKVSLPGTAIADILVPASGDKKASVLDISSSYLTKVTDGEYSISWNILGNSKDYSSDFLSKAKTDTLSEAQIPHAALAVDAQPDISKLSHDEQMTALPNLFSTATYKDVIKNVDVDVTVTPDKLKENLIIKSPKDFTSVSYLINAGSLIAKIAEDNSVIFTNDRGDVVFTIPTPLMLDSNTMPEESLDIAVALEKTTQGYILTLTPDSKWMNDPARVYPVILDPTVKTTQSQANIMETYIHSGDTAGEHYTSSYIRIGDTDIAICRGYVDFATRPTIDTTHNYITSADFIGYLVSGTSTYHQMKIYQTDDTWSASTITWANRPTNTYLSAANGVLSGSYYKYIFDVESSVKNWYATGEQNGYMIKYTDETINDYNWFYSSDHPTISTSYYPCLSIGYTEDITNPSISITPSNTTNVKTTQGDSLWSTANVSFTATASDGGVGLNTNSYEYHIEKLDEPLVGSNYPLGPYATTTVSGSSCTINTDGQFKVTATVKDKAGHEGSSQTYYVKIDKKAPYLSVSPPAGENSIKYTKNGSTVTADVWVTDDNIVSYPQPVPNPPITYSRPASGLAKFKLTTAGTYTLISGAPKDYKVTVVLPSSNPIANLEVQDTLGNSGTIPLNAGDTFDPNAPSIIERNGHFEIVDNLDITNVVGATGPCAYFEYKIGNGSYTLYGGSFEIDRNVDSVIYARAIDANNNISAVASVTIPKEIGVYKETATDINYNQVAVPLSITRTYKSNTNTWAFSFDTKVNSLTSHVKSITLQNGETRYYTYINDFEYQGTSPDDVMTISGGYYFVDIDGYHYKYRTSDGKIYAIYQNSSATSPLAQYSYDANGTHIAIGTHTININTTKTSVEVKKGTETLATASYTFTSGQLTSATDAMGKISTYTYSSNLLHEYALGDGNTSKILKTFTFTNGQIAGVDNPNGSYIHYEYAASTNINYLGSTTITEKYSNAPDSVYYEYNDLTIIPDGTPTGGGTGGDPGTTPGSLYTQYDETQSFILYEQNTINTYTYYNYDGDVITDVAKVYNTGSAFADYGDVPQINIYDLSSTTFDTMGRVSSESVQRKIDGTMTQISLTEYTYDSYGRTAITTDTSQSGVITVTENTYNGFGLLTENTVTVNSGTPKVTHYYYDQYGVLLKQSGDSGTIRNLYDSFGRKSKEVSSDYYNPANDSLSVNSESMATSSGTYSVDANTTRYSYDSNWNLEGKTSQDSITTAYSYDAHGNQIQQNFDYYQINKNSIGATSNINVGTQQLGFQELINLEYWDSGLIKNKNFDNDQTIHYEYDADGNVTSVNYIKNGVTTSAFSHGVLNGNLIDTDNINGTVTTHYTSGVNEICDSDTDPIYTYYNGGIYDTSNGEGQQFLEEFYPNDTTLNYITQHFSSLDVFHADSGNSTIYKNYNRTDDRLNASTVNLNSKNGTQLMSTAYSYDGDKVSSMSNTIGTVTTAYCYQYINEQISKITIGGDDVDYIYDTNNQLIRVNDETLNKTFTYSYNSRGNKTSKSIYAYTTDPNPGTPISTDSYAYGDSSWPDKLTSYKGQAISYDNIGNPISYKGYAMTWIAGRMLDSMENSNYKYSFNYDENGIRTRKTAYNKSTQTIDKVVNYTTIDGRITSQSDGTNALYFHYDNDNQLAGVMINGTEYVYAKNLQGDVVSLVDTSGNIVVNYSYNPWGEVESITGSLASTIGQINPMRYRGYYQDSETGLYYLQTRYYDPDTCRFINADTTDILGVDNSRNGLVLFTYCNNNPIMGYDPMGMGSAYFIGAGIQIELTILGLCGGIEAVWYISNQVNVGGRSRGVPYFYGYRGGSAGPDARTRSAFVKLCENPSLLLNPKTLFTGVSFSVCVFAIFGPSTFTSPTQYRGPFKGGYVTAIHGKLYSGVSSSSTVIGAGWSSSYWGCGATYTTYYSMSQIAVNCQKLFNTATAKAYTIRR